MTGVNKSKVCEVFAANVALSALLLMTAGLSHACLTVEDWHVQPLAETVSSADDVYLAKFVRLEAENAEEISVVLTVSEVLKGRPSQNLKIPTFQVSAIHTKDRVFDDRHADPGFWKGERRSSVLMGDCTYAPVEYYEEGNYLVLLHDGRLKSKVAFERISTVTEDLWYGYVKCHTRESMTPARFEECEQIRPIPTSVSSSVNDTIQK